MTLGVRLLASGGKQELHYEENPFVVEDGPILMVMNPAHYHGHFKTATRTTTGTTIIVTPKPGISIVVTDILISGEKQAGSNVTLQFTDGVNTEVIVIADQVDATPTLAAGLNAYFHGWKDARVEVVTGGAGDATVTIGYMHSHRGLTYSEWDAER